MKKTKGFLLLLLCIPHLLYSKEKFYPFSTISEELFKNACAVIRYEKKTLSIQSDNSARLNNYRVITILNAYGVDHGVLYGYYDKEKKLSQISFTIYDADGNLVEKVDSDDFLDMSAYSGYSLYEDNRIIYYKPYIRGYPYTVEIEYTINYKGYIHLPWWQPQFANDISVENSILEVNTDANNEIRAKSVNLENDVTVHQNGNRSTYTWEVNNIRAFEDEPYSLPYSQLTPIVYIAPNNFTYGGYHGNMSTWGNYGKWVRNLIYGLDVLDDESKNVVSKIKSESSDTIELVKRIYKHLQENTRYVSIQYGIGGFKPFDAAMVSENGYGDCKALTNYTMALLKEAGIRSNYTLVRAGSSRQEIMADFPGQYFNHVILCVPLSYDTIWLECTSQDCPFGYLGDFTDNRLVLVITDQGGILTRTPEYSQESNVIRTKSLIDVKGNGNATINTTMNCSGIMYDDFYGLIYKDYSDQRKWLYENLWFTNFTITDLKISENRAIVPDVNINFDLEVSKFSSVSGKRLFIQNRLLSRMQNLTTNDKIRKSDIFIKRGFIIRDTIQYTVSNEYQLENYPENIFLSYEFGEYQSELQPNGNKILFTRQLRLNKGIYPKELYSDFIDFYENMVNHEKSLIVFKKSE